MPEETLTITDNRTGREYTLPIVDGTIRTTDLRQLSASVGTFLYETGPHDLGIFVAAITTLAAAGLLASALPARRAASVDPLVALRQE